MTHIALSAVKVSVGPASGNRIARILREGDIVPEGVADEVLTRLLVRGLIQEVPSDEELAVVDAALREEEELAAEAELEKRIEAAAERLLAERDEAAGHAAAAAKAAEAAEAAKNAAGTQQQPKAAQNPPKPAGK